MAGSFVAISHHGVVDAHQLLDQLYQRTGDLSEPLADIGEGLALSHRDRWDDQESPEGEPWAWTARMRLSMWIGRRRCKGWIAERRGAPPLSNLVICNLSF